MRQFVWIGLQRQTRNGTNTGQQQLHTPPDLPTPPPCNLGEIVGELLSLPPDPGCTYRAWGPLGGRSWWTEERSYRLHDGRSSGAACDESGSGEDRCGWSMRGRVGEVASCVMKAHWRIPAMKG